MIKKSFLSLFVLLTAFVYADAQALKYSEDGKTLAVNFPVTFGTDKLINQVVFFDVTSGKIKNSAKLTELEYDKPKMMFAAGNQGFLAADRGDTSVVKITADDKTEVKEFASELEDYDHPLIALAQSPDGKSLFKLFNHKLSVYNFSTQTLNAEDEKTPAKVEGENTKSAFLAIQPNGRILVEYQKKAAEHSLVIHDLAAKTSKTIKLPYDYSANDAATFTAEISENGERLALKCEKESVSQITIWDLKTSANLGEFSFPDRSEEAETNFYPINNFALSPNGKKLVVKIDEMFADENDAVVLWDIAAKKETAVEAKHYSTEYFAKNVVFTPDSKILAVSSEVLLPGLLMPKIQLFDANTGKFIREF